MQLWGSNCISRALFCNILSVLSETSIFYSFWSMGNFTNNLKRFQIGERANGGIFMCKG